MTCLSEIYLYLNKTISSAGKNKNAPLFNEIWKQNANEIRDKFINNLSRLSVVQVFRDKSNGKNKTISPTSEFEIPPLAKTTASEISLN